MIRPGGHIVIYAPNRLYPFETHGIYLGKRFVFGNIPLVNWLPDPLRNRLVPHARAYTKRGIRRTYAGPGRARAYRDVRLSRVRQHHRAAQAAWAPCCARCCIARSTRRCGCSGCRTSSCCRSRRQRRQGQAGGRVGTTQRDAAHARATACAAAPDDGHGAAPRWLQVIVALAGLGVIAVADRRRHRLRRLPLVRQRPRAARRGDRAAAVGRRADLRPQRQAALRVRRRPLRPALAGEARRHLAVDDRRDDLDRGRQLLEQPGRQHHGTRPRRPRGAAPAQRRRGEHDGRQLDHAAAREERLHLARTTATSARTSASSRRPSTRSS